MDALKIVTLGASVMIVAILLTYMMGLTETGKDTFNKGSNTLITNVTAFSSSQYDVYDGTSQTGESVIRIINSSFNDQNVEVLVSTADGYNFVYNISGMPIYGASKTAPPTITYDSGDNYGKVYLIADLQNNQALSNLATYDATGKHFDATAEGVAEIALVQKAPTTGHTVTDYTGADNLNVPVCTTTGYSAIAPMMAPGYISSSAYFACSVQKDINGDVRRVTFVQK